ncbi:MAG: hypothetical protein JXQ76_00850, partial [Campylobacterales bacterium]|nr:hypothetical protein [Campylobacterales bacterium]
NNFYAMEKIQDIVQFLKIASDKTHYYFSYDILMAHDDLLIKKEDFDRIAKDFTLPQEIIDMVHSHRFNRKTIKHLRKLLDFDYESHYLPSDFNERVQNDFEKCVDSLEHFISKKLFDTKCQEAFVPEFFKNKIQNAPLDAYLESAKLFSVMEALKRSEYEKLQKDYYLPPIDTNIKEEEFATFAAQVSLMNDLIIEGLLISKESLADLSPHLPKSLQKSIQESQYDYQTAQAIERLKKFDVNQYVLPDLFYEQLQSSFFKVTSSLDKCLKRSDYEAYFVPNRIKMLLLKSNFATYISLSQLISQSAIDEAYLKELQQDQAFLDALKLNLDNLNEIDEKALMMIKKIKDANVDRSAYIQMMAVYERVMKSKSEKLKSYFKKLRSLDTPWTHTDAKIIEYIHDYKMTIKTTFENITYNRFSHYSWLSTKIALATMLFKLWASHIQSSVALLIALIIYIPVAIVALIRHEDLKFMQIYTNPFQIVLDNIDRNEEFSRRVDRVVR